MPTNLLNGGTQLQSGSVDQSRLKVSSITALTALAQVGTITSGTWQASPVAVQYGGTGSSTASDARSALGLAIGSDVQAHSGNLDNLALNAQVPVIYGGTGASSASAARANLGLSIGSNVQAWNAKLDAVSNDTYSGASSITTVGALASGSLAYTFSPIMASLLPSLDAITKAAADVDLNSHKIVNLAAPQNANDAARLVDVQGAQAGLYWKAPVQVISSSNISVSAVPSTIDGVTMSANMRFALGGQTNAAENGIYVYPASAGSAASRASDADGSASGVVKQGMAFFVEAGSQAGQGFVLNTANPITVGTTALTFVKFTGTGDLTFGYGLGKSGNQINLVLADGSLSTSSSGLQVASAGIGSAQLAANAVVASKIAASAVGAGLQGGAGSAIALNPTYDAFVADGTHNVYTLNQSVVAASVYEMGQLVANGDFSISGTTLTLNYTPVSGQNIEVRAFHA